MLKTLLRFLRFLQLKDSLLDGLKSLVFILVSIFLFTTLDNGLSQFWRKLFVLTGENRFFHYHGTSLLLLLLFGYFIGRFPRTLIFMKTFGRIIVKIPKVAEGYRAFVLRLYTKKGFFKPVIVHENFLVETDPNTGETIRLLLGGERRALFLREISFRNSPNKPKIFQKQCEVLITGQSLIGGSPKFFPFECVEAQTYPSSKDFWKAITTAGVNGYQEIETKPWREVRKEVGKLLNIPEKDRSILNSLGIILPSSEAIID